MTLEVSSSIPPRFNFCKLVYCRYQIRKIKNCPLRNTCSERKHGAVVSCWSTGNFCCSLSIPWKKLKKSISRLIWKVSCDLLSFTLPETNTAPETGWLEGYFPFRKASTQVRTVSFRGPIFISFKIQGHTPNLYQQALVGFLGGLPGVGVCCIAFLHKRHPRRSLHNINRAFWGNGWQTLAQRFTALHWQDPVGWRVDEGHCHGRFPSKVADPRPISFK